MANKGSKSDKESSLEKFSVPEENEAGKFEEGDRWDKRWEDFDDMFDEFDPAPEMMEGIWMESDLRQRKIEKVRKLLRGENIDSIFGEEGDEVLEGLKSSLGYFSYIQLEELQRLVGKVDEGVAKQREQERFEKSSKTEARD